MYSYRHVCNKALTLYLCLNGMISSLEQTQDAWICRLVDNCHWPLHCPWRNVHDLMFLMSSRRVGIVVNTPGGIKQSGCTLTQMSPWLQQFVYQTLAVRIK